MIRIGQTGSGGLGNLKGIRKAARMKADCMKVEFTYEVRMSMDAAMIKCLLLKMEHRFEYFHISFME